MQGKDIVLFLQFKRRNFFIVLVFSFVLIFLGVGRVVWLVFDNYGCRFFGVFIFFLYLFSVIKVGKCVFQQFKFQEKCSKVVYYCCIFNFRLQVSFLLVFICLNFLYFLIIQNLGSEDMVVIDQFFKVSVIYIINCSFYFD